MEFSSCLNKQEKLKAQFSSFKASDQKYHAIMEMGRKLEPLPSQYKTPANLVKGCQSNLYLKVSFENGVMHYIAASDALISAGLAALLIAAYQNEPPEAILKCPPLFLKEVGILESLSPSRSNGVRSLYLKMHEHALLAIAS